MLLKNRIFQVVLLLIVISFPLLLSLDKLPVFLWDEVRLATNSLEMHKTGLSIITTFNYEPEWWNTKPPLLIWLQTLSFNLFGVSEFTLRLPSVLAAFGTCMMMYWFCRRQLKRPWTGILASVILLTSLGYMNYHHSARTGDYDATLTFFTTSYLLLFFAYIEEEKDKLLLLTFAMMTCAVLTKGIAGMLISPVLLIYTIYRNKVLFILRSRAFYIGLLSFIGIVAGYYLLREHYQPGYLKSVNANELGGRYVEVGVNTNQSIQDRFFYSNLLINKNFENWYWILPVVILAGAFSKEKKYRDIIFYLTVAAGILLLVLSRATGRNDWYDMPAYPLLSIVVALGLTKFGELLVERAEPEYRSIVTGVVALLIMLLLANPYYETIRDITAPDPGEWIAENTSVTYYLRDIFHDKTNLHNFTVIKNQEYEANVNWYSEVLNDKGYHTRVVDIDGTRPVDGVVPGDTIITYQAGVKDFIQYYYTLSALDSDGRVKVYKVNGVPEQIH